MVKRAALLLLVLLLVIFALGPTPLVDEATSPLLHALSGALLLWALAWVWPGRLGRQLGLVALAALLLEPLQALLPFGRQADPLDALAGIAGSLTAALALGMVAAFRLR
jgi:hypothetical protein